LTTEISQQPNATHTTNLPSSQHLLPTFYIEKNPVDNAVTQFIATVLNTAARQYKLPISKVVNFPEIYGNIS